MPVAYRHQLFDALVGDGVQAMRLVAEVSPRRVTLQVNTQCNSVVLLVISVKDCLDDISSLETNGLCVAVAGELTIAI